MNFSRAAFSPTSPSPLLLFLKTRDRAHADGAHNRSNIRVRTTGSRSDRGARPPGTSHFCYRHLPSLSSPPFLPFFLSFSPSIVACKSRPIIRKVLVLVKHKGDRDPAVGLSLPLQHFLFPSPPSLFLYNNGKRDIQLREGNWSFAIVGPTSPMPRVTVLRPVLSLPPPPFPKAGLIQKRQRRSPGSSSRALTGSTLFPPSFPSFLLAATSKLTTRTRQRAR